MSVFGRLGGALLFLQCVFLGAVLQARPTGASEVSATSRETDAKVGSINVQYTSEVARIVCIVADGSQLIVDKAAGEYGLIHNSVQVTTLEFDPTDDAASPELAFNAIARGEADFAIIPFTPTPAQSAASPDLLYLPIFASGFAAVYNLPEVGDLVLSLFVLSRIFTGNITMWNDPRIVEANPGRHMPKQSIQMVLQQEPRTVTRLFTRIAGQHDEYFASQIPESFEPTWPLERYAAYRFESGLDGPVSWVLSHPYSLALSFLSVAEGLGVDIASMINPAGNRVQPTYATLSATFNERVVSSSLDTAGHVGYTYDSDLDLAQGPDSWPFVMANTLVISKDYSVQTCVERAEVLKFLRWMQGADAIRYMLMQENFATMITDEVDLQLGWLDKVLALTCEGEEIADGAYEPITLAGGNADTIHTPLQNILLAEYGRQDGVASYEFHVESEESALEGLIDPVEAFPDLLWLHPLTFSILFPARDDKYIQSGQMLALHLGIQGVLPQYNFPDTVRAKMTTLTEQNLPIRLDMETLAAIFLGDITSWIDPRIVARNPELTSAYLMEDATITLILCGTGVLADASKFVIGNHFLLGLNSTQAFQQSGIPFSLPIDWRPITAKLDAQGSRYVMADSEIAMEELIARTPGGIGYVLAFSNSTNLGTDIQIVKPVLLTNGTVSEHTVAATPASFLALAATATPSQDASFALINAQSNDPTLQDAWPLPIVVSIGVNADTAASDELVVSVLSLCFRARRAVDFAAWMAGDEDVVAPSTRSGRASLSQLDAWKEQFAALLHTATCDGEPVLWKRPVVWSMPESIQIIGQAAGGLGVAIVVFSMAMLVAFRKRTILRTANLPLQFISLSGLLLLFIGAIAYSSPPSLASCDALGWLLCLGASATFAPMCAKIVRVYHIHGQRRTLKLKKLSNRKLQIASALWIGLHVALMIVSDGDGGGLLTPQTWSLPDDDGRDHFHTQCSVTGRASPFAATIICLQAVLLLGSTLISLAIRHVSSAFNESRNIMWAIWNVMITALAIIPIMLLVTGREGDVPVFLKLFFVLAVGFGTLVLTFGWKFAAIFDEELSIRRANLSTGSRGASMGVGLLTGEKGTTTSSNTYTSIFNLPSLESVSLTVLEKYLMALESQIRLAKEKRKQVFGSEFRPAPNTASEGPRPDELSILGGDEVKTRPPIPSSVFPNLKLDPIDNGHQEGKLDGDPAIPHIPGIPSATSPVWRALHRPSPSRQPIATQKPIRIQAKVREALQPRAASPLPQDPLIAAAARLAHKRPPAGRLPTRTPSSTITPHTPPSPAIEVPVP